MPITFRDGSKSVPVIGVENRDSLDLLAPHRDATGNPVTLWVRCAISGAPFRRSHGRQSSREPLRSVPHTPSGPESDFTMNLFSRVQGANRGGTFVTDAVVRHVGKVLMLAFLSLAVGLVSTLDAAIVTPESIEVGAGRAIRGVLVQEVGTWTVDDDVSWLAASVPGGEGDRNVDITIEPNTTGASRTGSLHIGNTNLTVTQRAAGSGLRELWALGDGTYGQLGDSAIIDRSSLLTGATGIAAVTAGHDHSLFLRTDGTLWAVGYNSFGQLGDGTTTSRTEPVLVAAGVAQVATSYMHTVFVKADGTLWATGLNVDGALGDGTTANHCTPVLVTSGVVAAAAGSYHSLFVKSDGTLWGMGSNFSGQLGVVTPDGHATRPVQIASGVAAAVAGANHSLFRKTDGTLWAMGANAEGELGDGTTTDRSTPVQVATGVASVSAGDFHSLFVKTDGTLWTTGYNYYGQLGDNSGRTFRSAPVQVATNVARAAGGESHSIFVKTDGTLWAMGRNTEQQLGDGTGVDKSLPAKAATGVAIVAAGGDHCLFLTTSGELGAFGDNSFGQLADGTTFAREVPAQVGTDVVALAAGDAHSLFLKSDGTLWVCGDNSEGQLGFPLDWSQSTPARWSTPRRLWMEHVASMSAGIYHSLILMTDGSVSGMGANYDGQLGNGGTTLSVSNGPTPIMNGVTAVEAGGFHSMFLKTDGSLWATGSNFAGQLGDGTFIDRLSPVQVATNVAKIAAGVFHTLFIKTDGTLWAMGSNEYGQLGDGTTTDRNSPVQIATNVASCEAGYFHSVFVKTDGSLWAMGSNWWGETGDIADPDHKVPNWIASGVAFAAAGGSTTLFVKTDGTLFGKGNYESGQIGYVDAGWAESPVYIARGVTAVAAGGMHTLFIASGEIGTTPQFASQATPQTAVIGGSVTLGVTVTATGPITYQWKRNGVNIPGATDATLTLTNVQAAQGGNYSVVVSNLLGTITSNAAPLTIDSTPRLINVSCRAFAGAGDDTLVMGFYISGTGEKTLLIRGIGPRLSFYNVPSVVADPEIRVYRDNTIIAGNEDWNASLAASFAQVGAFELIPGSKDAAMTITLPPGLYTVHLVNDGPVAEGLIEVYDLSRDLGSRLTNVSCRLNLKSSQLVILGTGLIGGPVSVLARNVGPGLAQYLPNPSEVLSDPHLRVYSGGTEIAVNDDWELATRAYFGPTGAFDLTNGSKDAAIRVPFTPGGVTVHATGVAGSTGIALIELYESP